MVASNRIQKRLILKTQNMMIFLRKLILKQLKEFTNLILPNMCKLQALMLRYFIMLIMFIVLIYFFLKKYFTFTHVCIDRYCKLPLIYTWMMSIRLLKLFSWSSCNFFTNCFTLIWVTSVVYFVICVFILIF